MSTAATARNGASTRKGSCGRGTNNGSEYKPRDSKSREFSEPWSGIVRVGVTTIERTAGRSAPAASRLTNRETTNPAGELASENPTRQSASAQAPAITRRRAKTPVGETGQQHLRNERPNECCGGNEPVRGSRESELLSEIVHDSERQARPRHHEGGHVQPYLQRDAFRVV